MNIEIAKKTIKELVCQGVRSFCLCPGGRLAPFVEVLSRSKGLDVLSFFEERSASFFALGRAERDNRPVAILTTSGTAVAELLPSAIESHYSGQTLVFITADRPLEQGQQGAPQTLKSAVHILKDYCQSAKNILNLKDVDLSGWTASKGSLHLNICFDEPLIDQTVPSVDFSKYFNSSKKNSERKKQKQHVESEQVNFNKEIKRFFQQCKKPLFLIGELKPQEKPLVKALLSRHKGLFYTEPLSGLIDMPGLISGEKILDYALKTKAIDGVIRLGGIPRVRFWRDLEKNQLPVLSLSSPPFYAGLSRPSFNAPLTEVLDRLKPFLSSLKNFGESVWEKDRHQVKRWKLILKEHPQSEEFWFWTLKKSLRENSKVFLGNSLPIRLWDRIAFCEKKNLSITNQTGGSGIEGLISHFLGGVSSKANNVGILGDLSLLYDMPGFWRSKDLPPWTLIVINNFGGQIFSRIFKNPAFLNSHSLTFSSLAKMWGLNYRFYKKSEAFQWPDVPYCLVEIQPEKEDTKACFGKYVSIWDSL